MNLFRRKEPTEPATPVAPSPREIAERAVEAADARLSQMHREFLELQRAHRLFVDENGNIFQPLLADGTSRDEIARKIHEYRIARGVALRQFHAALGAWAKAKSDAVGGPPAI